VCEDALTSWLFPTEGKFTIPDEMCWPADSKAFDKAYF